jgi:glycosyltransferase involved in cell wall biosynthesis
MLALIAVIGFTVCFAVKAEVDFRRLFTDEELSEFRPARTGQYCETYNSKYGYSCANPKRVLVIPQSFPMPTMHGSDKRAYHLIETFKALGHTVAVAPFSRTGAKASDDDKGLLKALGVNIFPSYITQKSPGKNFTKTYANILKKVKPDLIAMWLWFWDIKMTAPGYLIPLTRKLSPHAKILLFTDDVHSKRERQIAQQFKNLKAYNHYQRRSVYMLSQERQSYAAADTVVSITEADRMDIVGMDAARPDHVYSMRFILSPWDELKRDEQIKDFEGRSGLIFVGNGENPTNIHAMKWYVDSVANELWKGLPGVKCYVVGQEWDLFARNNPKSSKYLIFLGALSTSEMNKAIDSAMVFVAPIRASTGINTKNVLALSRGIPLVTTPAGAVGMCDGCDSVILFNPMDPFESQDNRGRVTSSIPLLLGRDVYDFAEKVKTVYYSEAEWKKYSNAGYEHVRKWFGRDKAAEELDVIIRKTY